MANLIIRDDNDLEERYTPREMFDKINLYFDLLIEQQDEYMEALNNGEKMKKPKRPTTSGLALFLGFPSRRAMNKVQADGAYALIIERGISMIEEYMEEELYSAHCGGAKFWLKNHGWVESQPKDFGTDKVINIIMEAEKVVLDDKEKDEKERLLLIQDLKEAGLDISKRVDVVEGKEVL